MKYNIVIITENGGARYHVHNKIHGHPKTSLLKENAKQYATETTANKAAKVIYGNGAKFYLVQA